KLKEIKSAISDANSSAESTIILEKIADNSPAESYQLSINEKGVKITASSGAGLFYGVQTLFQLFPADGSAQLPHVNISDAPRFSYRGLHLDVGRHFFPVSFIKRY